jgi:hypothetical protein
MLEGRPIWDGTMYVLFVDVDGMCVFGMSASTICVLTAFPAGKVVKTQRFWMNKQLKQLEKLLKHNGFD